MRAYSANGPNTSGTATTLVGVVGSATVRPTIYDLVLGALAAPVDQAARIAVSRFTAAGTATAFTPTPLDPSDVAAVCTAGITHTVEPTYTANQDLLTFGMNNRATFRWVAAPGYELRGPATAANGLGLRLAAASAAQVLHGTVSWFE